MRVNILSKIFDDRDNAKLWMSNRYAEYPDGSIVSSCFAESSSCITGYVIIDLDKLSGKKDKLSGKKLIKIT